MVQPSYSQASGLGCKVVGSRVSQSSVLQVRGRGEGSILGLLLALLCEVPAGHIVSILRLSGACAQRGSEFWICSPAARETCSTGPSLCPLEGPASLQILVGHLLGFARASWEARVAVSGCRGGSARGRAGSLKATGFLCRLLGL